MPRIADYRPLAPFNLEELVGAANSVLRGRPDLEVSIRTVRFYIARGLIPGPLGPPRKARYELEHLIRIVGYRLLQRRGVSLEAARETVDALLETGLDDALRAIDELLAEPAARSEREGQAFASVQHPRRSRGQGVSVWKAPLAPGVTLEVEDWVELGDALPEIQLALRRLAQMD